METGIQQTSVGRVDRLADLAFVIVVLLAVLVVALTYRDFGIGWDEGSQARYGDLTVEYFGSGFTDVRARRYGKSFGFGPVLEAGLSLVTSPSGLQRFQDRHLFTALFGLLVLPALFLCGRATGERWLAVVAAVALLTMPRFAGHLPNNAKDISFAVMWTVSLGVFAHLQKGPGRPWLRVLCAGLAVGLAGALRPGGFLLLAAFLGMALVLTVVAEGRETGAWGTSLLDAMVKGFVALCLGGVLLVLLWPPAHEAPLEQFLSTVQRTVDFDRVYSVLFAGEAVPSSALPRSYLIKFLVLATPTGASVLAALGFGAAVRRQLSAPLASKSRAFFLYQAWLIVPLVSFWLVRPNVYDGLRHFLFLLPAVALFAGYGALVVVRVVPAGVGRGFAIALVGLVLLLPVQDLVRLHPYQTSYFADVHGGLAGAEGRYETDYWATSYGEAVAWIRGQRGEGESPTQVLLGANNLAFLGFRHYADEDLSLARLRPKHSGAEVPAPFGYYVGSYRWGMAEAFPDSVVVHEISRDGVVFAVVKRAGEAETRPGSEGRP